MENEPLPPVPQPESTDLQAQLDSLQRLVISMLLLLIVVSGTLWIFLKRQLRNTSADLQAIRPAWTNSMAQYQRNGPIIEQTAKKFQDFARTNSDFAPILVKYGYGLTPATASSATPAKKTNSVPPAKK